MSTLTAGPPRPRTAPRATIAPSAVEAPIVSTRRTPATPKQHAEPKSIEERLKLIDKLARDDSMHGSYRPAKVTAALPGTEEKLREMEARIGRGEAACATNDLTTEDLRALGYDYTISPNGAIIWRRVMSQADRIAEIEGAAARRREARGG